MAIAMVEALHVLHATQRTYNDMKPQNIMISKDANNELKIILIDFGFCQKFVT
jgi:serine/threonine protein kinase|tara:strand:+ start:714 stop:872 length:159 start_codon:yes stop_codon:yes gene_type:complete